jgi:hypothetical protein
MRRGHLLGVVWRRWLERYMKLILRRGQGGMVAECAVIPRRFLRRGVAGFMNEAGR